MIFMITGLTHERRIWIVNALEPEPVDFDQLCRETRIPPMSLRRHLEKLQRRDIVGFEERMWRLATPRDALRRELICSAVEEITPAQV